MIGTSGAVVDELNGGGWVRSEIDVDGHHLATVTPAGVVFTHADWLGTERARTSVTANLCESLYSQPFGDNQTKGGPSGASCDPTPNFFTGKQRDTESNLDDFGARYFSSQWADLCNEIAGYSLRMRGGHRGPMAAATEEEPRRLSGWGRDRQRTFRSARVPGAHDGLGGGDLGAT